MNFAGLITSQRQKLSTSDATIGPAVKRTKPMTQGERKTSASRVSRLGPGCLRGEREWRAPARTTDAGAISAAAFASTAVPAVVIFSGPLARYSSCPLARYSGEG